MNINLLYNTVENIKKFIDKIIIEEKTMYKIMIIEDDESLANAVKTQIESWGNEVMCAHDFQNIIPAFLGFDPHMVLVDIMLPFFNGYYWCAEIRKISNVPVVFLSSASDNMNIVMADRKSVV